MKTLGRVLILVVAFAAMMGIIYAAVNAGGSAVAGAPEFQQNGERFSPPNNGEAREFHHRDEERGGSGFGMIFELLKNTIIIAFIVAIIALPKNLAQQKRRMAPVQAE